MRAGQVREVLDRLAEQRPDDDTIVSLAQVTLAETTEFVRGHDLVTVHDDPVEIVVMPEIHRGVAVAYCQPPGPLESAPLPTFFAVYAVSTATVPPRRTARPSTRSRRRRPTGRLSGSSRSSASTTPT